MPLHEFKFLVRFICYAFMTKRLVYFQVSARKRSQIKILNENTKNVTINEICPYTSNLQLDLHFNCTMVTYFYS